MGEIDHLSGWVSSQIFGNRKIFSRILVSKEKAMWQRKVLSVLAGAALFASACASCEFASAAPSSWNAYSDFYLDPTATGWTGATSPSVSGSAWGYYSANVNGFGFPTEIGSYFTPTGSGAGSQNLYQYSNYSPLGPGALLSTSLWDPTGGAGFPRYTDNQGWGSSLGRYDNPWFPGAPGTSQSLSNFIWMQSGWLSGGSSEGIGVVLSWTAPATGDYTFSGQWVSGDQPTNSTSVAILDSLGGGAILGKTILANNSVAPISFTKSYSAGDVVQFQVGNNFSMGNAVGLQLSIVPEPSAMVLLATAAVGAAVCAYRRRK